jgi:hypothetical protein
MKTAIMDNIEDGHEFTLQERHIKKTMEKLGIRSTGGMAGSSPQRRSTMALNDAKTQLSENIRESDYLAEDEERTYLS